MARITRKELKSDRFALEVGHTVEYVEAHKGQILRYAAIGLAVLVLALGGYFFLRQRQSTRLEVLSQALRVQQATVGDAAGTPGLNFPTQEAKSQAATKALSDFMSTYPSSDEAVMARYFMASQYVDEGKLAEAEKAYQQVSESGVAELAPLSRMALGEIYFATNRPAEGEKLLRALMASPTSYVSREQATIVLARQLARAKPEEASKLLEALATQNPNSAASRIAVGLMGEISAR